MDRASASGAEGRRSDSYLVHLKRSGLVSRFLLLMNKFIYIFLDGIGLAPASSFNPFSLVEALPYLNGRLNGSLLAGHEVYQPQLLFKPIDACLGIKGRPQSATGQTALYTGRNASAFLGRHLTGFANGSLRILIEESGIFKQVKALGGRVTSANVYSPAYFQAIEDRKIRYSVGVLLSLTAEVRFRMPADYWQGEAISWDITNRYTGERGSMLPVISSQEAGKRLAYIAREHEVTLYESYLTDYVGHSQDLAQAQTVLQDVDGLIEGVLENMDSETTLVISSDHGNLENLETRLHTLNPVPLFVFGKGAVWFADVDSIMGITPIIIKNL